jgi:hypothetical protein
LAEHLPKDSAETLSEQAPADEQEFPDELPLNWWEIEEEDHDDPDNT